MFISASECMLLQKITSDVFLHSWPQCIHPHELVQPTIYKELLLNTFKAI